MTFKMKAGKLNELLENGWSLKEIALFIGELKEAKNVATDKRINPNR